MNAKRIRVGIKPHVKIQWEVSAVPVQKISPEILSAPVLVSGTRLPLTSNKSSVEALGYIE